MGNAYSKGMVYSCWAWYIAFLYPFCALIAEFVFYLLDFLLCSILLASVKHRSRDDLSVVRLSYASGAGFPLFPGLADSNSCFWEVLITHIDVRYLSFSSLYLLMPFCLPFPKICSDFFFNQSFSTVS